MNESAGCWENEGERGKKCRREFCDVQQKGVSKRYYIKNIFIEEAM